MVPLDLLEDSAGRPAASWRHAIEKLEKLKLILADRPCLKGMTLRRHAPETGSATFDGQALGTENRISKALGKLLLEMHAWNTVKSSAGSSDNRLPSSLTGVLASVRYC